MRATDLDMKVCYLRRRNGPRVVTFATATPIANSGTEAYVMQRYLRPDLLSDTVCARTWERPVRSLDENPKVEFDTTQGQKGPQAENVRPL